MRHPANGDAVGGNLHFMASRNVRGPVGWAEGAGLPSNGQDPCATPLPRRESSHRPTDRTSGFQSENAGSIPAGSTTRDGPKGLGYPTVYWTSTPDLYLVRPIRLIPSSNGPRCPVVCRRMRVRVPLGSPLSQFRAERARLFQHRPSEGRLGGSSQGCCGFDSRLEMALPCPPPCPEPFSLRRFLLVARCPATVGRRRCNSVQPAPHAPVSQLGRGTRLRSAPVSVQIRLGVPEIQPQRFTYAQNATPIRPTPTTKKLGLGRRGTSGTVPPARFPISGPSHPPAKFWMGGEDGESRKTVNLLPSGRWVRVPPHPPQADIGRVAQSQCSASRPIPVKGAKGVRHAA